jgi:hypothetical protein
MTLPPTLSATTLEQPAMDYAFLRREGIRLLEQYGGKWTDFNTHDPGITILEQVCYAITDLAYRINYDIKDLLASGEAQPYHSIYSPAEILMINPVTLIDLRKLVIDIPGVKNAWIEQVEGSEPPLLHDPSDESIYLETSTAKSAQREPIDLRGIYRVLIEKDADSTVSMSSILTEVNRRLQACRPVSEDFTVPKILDVQGIVVHAIVEIESVEDPERLLAKIQLALAEFISPHIHFYTLAEMLNTGKRMDEIMNGPVLEHGFIEDAELEKLERKTSIRTSDLIQEIMNVEGVAAINKINIASGNQTEDWYLTLDADLAPFFDIGASLSTIHLVRGGVEILPSLKRVGELIAGMQTAAHGGALPESQRDFRVSPGSDRKISHYHSIQHQFPATYGIGALGLPESASPQRKAQAKQLKAYLLFFDQLLANTFAQLANAHKLFAFSSHEVRTYFSQIVEDAGLGLDEIRVKEMNAHARKLQSITEGSVSARARKNRFLNHLLARFAEQFTDYSLIQSADLTKQDLIKDKAAFLRDYKEIGTSRGTGFNYTTPSNSSGLEKRIRRKLGIAEGEFHMLEHILLRPRAADGEQFKQGNSGTNWQAGAFLAKSNRRDPYSHQISFVFPDWTTRSENTGFKSLIEKTLREETPAHIRVHIHWLDEQRMMDFRSVYKAWLENMSTGGIKFRDARDRLVQALRIGLPYPMRDIPLGPPVHPSEMVAYDHNAKIQITGAQIGVTYVLCDEDGNPIIDENGNRFEVMPEADGAEEKVLLPTPKIQRDITFTILAIRTDGNPEIRLEVYLNDAASIKSGIETSLQVTFQPDEDQIAVNNQIITNYDSKVIVQIEKSQAGISYKLVTVINGEQIDLSDFQLGNREKISLVSTVNFTEDIQLHIFAYRTTDETISMFLDTSLLVKVRPNPIVAVDLQPVIVDYGAEVTLSLTDPQATAGYRLYQRQLIPDDYLSNAMVGIIQIHTDEGLDVLIKAPEKIMDWESANGFVLVDEFKDSKGVLSVNTGKLLEDTFFIVRASKNENGESLQLDQAMVVLVRPDTTPTVKVSKSEVEMIEINNTQKGVAYQLLVDNVPVNPPGYDIADRGVNTTRLEVDFVVEVQEMVILSMPTGPITKTTKFNVLATKIFTGVSAQLTDTATLKVAK